MSGAGWQPDSLMVAACRAADSVALLKEHLHLSEMVALKSEE